MHVRRVHRVPRPEELEHVGLRDELEQSRIPLLLRVQPVPVPYELATHEVLDRRDLLDDGKVTVRVRDENSAIRPGAIVFHEGRRGRRVGGVDANAQADIGDEHRVAEHRELAPELPALDGARGPEPELRLAHLAAPPEHPLRGIELDPLDVGHEPEQRPTAIGQCAVASFVVGDLAGDEGGRASPHLFGLVDQSPHGVVDDAGLVGERQHGVHDVRLHRAQSVGAELDVVVEEIAIVISDDGHAPRPRAGHDALRWQPNLFDTAARVREQLVERDHAVAVQVGIPCRDPFRELTCDPAVEPHAPRVRHQDAQRETGEGLFERTQAIAPRREAIVVGEGAIEDHDDWPARGPDGVPHCVDGNGGQRRRCLPGSGREAQATVVVTRRRARKTRPRSTHLRHDCMRPETRGGRPRPARR